MAIDSGTIEAGQDNSAINGFWPNFNVDGPYFDVEECAQAGDSMATFVLDQFGIPYYSTRGGTLASIDIKRMDAMTVINQSLMEEFPTNGRLVEAIVDEYGFVDFVEIGNTGGSGLSDIYYTVQTKTLTDTCKGVMVTGKRPLPLRKNIEFKPIWGEGENTSLYKYNFQDMLGNCSLKSFQRYCTMTFTDPYLDTKYEDGVNNLLSR